MNRSLLKVLVALAVMLAFTVVSVSAFAADKKYFVIKDTKGVCKVIQAKEKTPASISGPFDKKQNAEKSKNDLCPKRTRSQKTRQIGKIIVKHRSLQNALYVSKNRSSCKQDGRFLQI